MRIREEKARKCFLEEVTPALPPEKLGVKQIKGRDME